MKTDTSHKALLTRQITKMSGCTCFNLRRTTRVVTQLYDRALKPIGLTGTLFTLLVVVSATGAPAIVNLAKRLLMDRTTLTRNIKPLEKRKLLTTAKREDARTRIVTITQAGHTLLATAYPLWQETQKSIVGKFGEERWNSMMLDLNALTAIAE